MVALLIWGQEEPFKSDIFDHLTMQLNRLERCPVTAQVVGSSPTIAANKDDYRKSLQNQIYKEEKNLFCKFNFGPLYLRYCGIRIQHRVITNIVRKQSSYFLWGMELQEVTTCFAHRKSDGFDSHILHQSIVVDSFRAKTQTATLYLTLYNIFGLCNCVFYMGVW